MDRQCIPGYSGLELIQGHDIRHEPVRSKADADVAIDHILVGNSGGLGCKFRINQAILEHLLELCKGFLHVRLRGAVGELAFFGDDPAFRIRIICFTDAAEVIPHGVVTGLHMQTILGLAAFDELVADIPDVFDGLREADAQFFHPVAADKDIGSIIGVRQGLRIAVDLTVNGDHAQRQTAVSKPAVLHFRKCFIFNQVIERNDLSCFSKLSNIALVRHNKDVREILVSCRQAQLGGIIIVMGPPVIFDFNIQAAAQNIGPAVGVVGFTIALAKLFHHVFNSRGIAVHHGDSRRFIIGSQIFGQTILFRPGSEIVDDIICPVLINGLIVLLLRSGSCKTADHSQREYQAQ